MATASRLIRIQYLSLGVVSDLWKLGEALKIDENVGICVGSVPINRKNTKSNNILDVYLVPVRSARPEGPARGLFYWAITMRFLFGEVSSTPCVYPTGLRSPAVDNF